MSGRHGGRVVGEKVCWREVWGAELGRECVGDVTRGGPKPKQSGHPSPHSAVTPNRGRAPSLAFEGARNQGSEMNLRAKGRALKQRCMDSLDITTTENPHSAQHHLVSLDMLLRFLSFVLRAQGRRGRRTWYRAIRLKVHGGETSKGEDRKGTHQASRPHQGRGRDGTKLYGWQASNGDGNARV
jgi:hypothetical protein